MSGFGLLVELYWAGSAVNAGATKPIFILSSSSENMGKQLVNQKQKKLCMKDTTQTFAIERKIKKIKKWVT